MNDVWLISDFFIQNKVNFKNISYEQNGSTDLYILYPTPTTNLKKIFNLSKNLGLICKSKTEPSIEYDYITGTVKISILKRELSSLNIKSSAIISKNYSKMSSPICMGTSSDGSTLIVDQMLVPNTIIGGSPGSGKSTLLHNMIINLIYSKTKTYIIDPKSNEFSLYRDVKNCDEVIDDMSEVPDLLDQFIETMNERYYMLKKYNSQSIVDFNLKFQKNQMDPIALVIDEWADLYLSNKNIINSITSLAQKGRAAGISIILATQRPSSQVLPGIIKASFSGRVALKCSSALESRIIMDVSGAEELSRGIAYYIDQNNLKPVLFSVPYSKNISEDILELGLISKKNQFSSFIDSIFR